MGKKKLKKTTKAVLNGFSRKVFPARASILIGMPTHHGISQFTHVCLDKTIYYFHERGIPLERYGPYGNAHVDSARNNVVDYFLNSKHTHLLWIDDDMVFDPEAIEMLLMHDVPISSAVITRRHPPYNPTIYHIVSDDKLGLVTRIVPFGTYPLDKPFYYPNSGIGTAFMLVKREVIEKMSPPIFASPPTSKGNIRGEDYYFCMRAGGLGYKILYDPRLPVYHMGECPFGIEDHIAMMRLMQEEGEEVCQYTNLNASSAALFKKSYAGANRSLIASAAPAAAKRHEELLHQLESKSDQPECQSSEKCDQTTQQTKTGTDQHKSQKQTE